MTSNDENANQSNVISLEDARKRKPGRPRKEPSAEASGDVHELLRAEATEDMRRAVSLLYSPNGAGARRMVEALPPWDVPTTFVEPYLYAIYRLGFDYMRKNDGVERVDTETRRQAVTRAKAVGGNDVVEMLSEMQDASTEECDAEAIAKRLKSVRRRERWAVAGARLQKAALGLNVSGKPSKAKPADADLALAIERARNELDTSNELAGLPPGVIASEDGSFEMELDNIAMVVVAKPYGDCIVYDEFAHIPRIQGQLYVSKSLSSITLDELGEHRRESMTHPGYSVTDPETGTAIVSVGPGLEDRHKNLIAMNLRRDYGASPTIDDVGRAIETSLGYRTVHPPREFFSKLRQRKHNLPKNFLTTIIPSLYKLTTANAYTERAFEKFMISIVARALSEERIKVDHMFGLIGPQAIAKTTFFSTMLPVQEWFTLFSEDLKDMDKGYEKLRGKVLALDDECAMVIGATPAKFNLFVPSQEDNFRMKYAKTTRGFKRECVFAFTANPTTIRGRLGSFEGNRRLWPIEVEAKPGSDDGSSFDEVHRFWAQRRLDVWALAVQRFDEGESWHFESDSDEFDMAARVREKYEGRPEDEAEVLDVATKQMQWPDNKGSVATLNVSKMVREEYGRTVSGKRVAKILADAKWECRKSNGLMRWFPPAPTD